MRISNKIASCWLGLTLALLLCAQAYAKELLTGEVSSADSTTLDFSLSGESRENVIGGKMQLGEVTFTITKTSRLGLIGGRRIATVSGGSKDTTYAEFAVLSSSFSAQTAVGQPWVAAQRYIGCDQDYNTFLAIYQVADEDVAKALGEAPYPVLSKDVSKSDQSTTYCFVSNPAP